jgi:diaminopimelate epimerase
MTMFNADGSEGEMCGNGIRCLVRYAQNRGAVPPDTAPVTVETASGVLDVLPIMDGGRLVRAQVRMGEPRFRPEDIPVDVGERAVVMGYPLTVDGRTFEISCVSMGNPHAVAFPDEDVDDVPLHEIGPLVEHHPIFPERVNFEIANVVDSNRVKARVWERGSGLTMACGTGACAVAVAARLHEYVDVDMMVDLPGGELQVRWPGQGDVVLEGPVEEVFDGEWPDDRVLGLC